MCQLVESIDSLNAQVFIRSALCSIEKLQNFYKYFTISVNWNEFDINGRSLNMERLQEIVNDSTISCTSGLENAWNFSNQTLVTKNVYNNQPSAGPSLSNTAQTIKCFFLVFVAFLNFFGNGLTMHAIRITPRLQTYTNFLIGSLTVSDLCVGVIIVYYAVWNFYIYIFNGNPCSVKAIFWLAPPIQQLPVFAANFHLGLLALDRYRQRFYIWIVVD